jgi:predicted dehydrogenase
MMRPSRRGIVKQVGGALACSLAGGLAPGRAAEGAARPRIKIGQIGVGHAHASKLAVYRRSADYEVVGVVEADVELRKRAETQDLYRGVTWMSQEKLLGTPGLQAVLVETRVGDLLRTAEACVAAGKHVHIDKPAGESLPHFRKVLDDAARQKLLVQMGYMYRYNPAVVLLRDFLAKGWLGEVFEVNAVMSKVVAPAERKRLAAFRGGILFELGCHVLDLVIAVLGKPAAVVPLTQHASRLDDRLADNMLAALTYPRALATVKSSAMEVEGFARRHLVVCGTEGTFHIQPLDSPSARVALSRPRGKYLKGVQDISFPKYIRYVDDAADMAQILRDEKSAAFSYQHDLAVQETLLRACALPLNR